MRTCSHPNCECPPTAHLFVVTNQTIAEELELCEKHAHAAIQRATVESSGSAVKLGEHVVALIAYFSMSTLHTVVLQHIDGKSSLSLELGVVETSSILTALRCPDPPRPMTHDLLRDVIKAMNGQLVAVHIGREMHEQGYYEAFLVVKCADHECLVDSRPSDAICLAIRSRVPVMVVGGPGKMGVEAVSETPCHRNKVDGVFIDSQCMYRRRASAMTSSVLLILLAIGVLFCAGVYESDHASWILWMFFCSAIVAVGGILAIVTACAIRFLRNDIDRLIVNHAGIAFGKRRWCWHEIRQLQITAVPGSGLLCMILWTTQRRLRQTIIADVVMTSQEIGETARRIEAFLSSQRLDTTLLNGARHK